jgi:hypothetical protein
MLVWLKTSRNPYWQAYRDQLPKLGYEFLHGSSDDSVERALRFTLATKIDAALVGSTSPEHFFKRPRVRRARSIAQFAIRIDSGAMEGNRAHRLDRSDVDRPPDSLHRAAPHRR